MLFNLKKNLLMIEMEQNIFTNMLVCLPLQFNMIGKI